MNHKVTKNIPINQLIFKYLYNYFTKFKQALSKKQINTKNNDK